MIVVGFGFHIEPRQPNCDAGGEHRGDNPHRLACQVGEIGTHFDHQKCGRHAERHQIAQAIELRPEIARDSHQPGDVTVQGIENHRQKNQPTAEDHVVRRIARIQSATEIRRIEFGDDLGIGWLSGVTREATTIAKNPQIKFPSVNIVGKTATVRIFFMRREGINDSLAGTAINVIRLRISQPHHAPL